MTNQPPKSKNSSSWPTSFTSAQKMKSTNMLIYAGVGIVIAAGVYAIWKYFPGSHKASTTASSGAKVIQVDLNANLAAPVITAPVEVKGDTKFSGTVNIKGVKVVFSSLQRVDTIDKVKAEPGTTFLKLFFNGVAPADADKVTAGLIADAHLLNGITVIPLDAVQVATTNVINNRGWLKFRVPLKTKFQLEIGSGATAQRVSIP